MHNSESTRDGANSQTDPERIRSMKNGSGGAQTVLITGGAGFIGTNLAQRFLAEPNIRVRIANAVANATRDVSEIYHLAAQVAVTTSIDAPETDFEINAQGTLRILEAARRSSRKPFVLFTSTNKVYGSLEGVPVHAAATRCEADAPDFSGVNEHEPLDFISPTAAA